MDQQNFSNNALPFSHQSSSNDNLDYLHFPDSDPTLSAESLGFTAGNVDAFNTQPTSTVPESSELLQKQIEQLQARLKKAEKPQGGIPNGTERPAMHYFHGVTSQNPTSQRTGLNTIQPQQLQLQMPQQSQQPQAQLTEHPNPQQIQNLQRFQHPQQSQQPQRPQLSPNLQQVQHTQPPLQVSLGFPSPQRSPLQSTLAKTTSNSLSAQNGRFSPCMSFDTRRQPPAKANNHNEPQQSSDRTDEQEWKPRKRRRQVDDIEDGDSSLWTVVSSLQKEVIAWRWKVFDLETFYRNAFQNLFDAAKMQNSILESISPGKEAQFNRISDYLGYLDQAQQKSRT